MTKVKVIYDKSVEGFNPGDSSHHTLEEAQEIVGTGDAHFAVEPTKQKPQINLAKEKHNDDDK